VALHEPAALLPLEIVGRGLEHRGGDVLRLLLHLAGRDRGGRARYRRRAAAVGAEAERGAVGVAVHDLDVLGRDAELLGHDLRERGLVALALRLAAHAEYGLAGGVHAQVGAAGHADADDVHVPSPPGAYRLGE